MVLKRFGSFSKKLLLWLFRSREYTNFTYDLSPLNKKYLASFVADVAGIEVEVAEKYLQELESDKELKQHILEETQKSDYAVAAEKKVHFGRRAGWYAIARATKPQVLIETGVDKGLGTCVLCAALLRNQEEGHKGVYYGTDINPAAGYLLTGKYAEVGEVLYGDSIESLKKLESKIDLFINDSAHSKIYEKDEYEVISDKLSERGIILGDNSHCSPSLYDFSLESKRRFLFFGEKPIDHWYEGCGIGASLPSSK